MRIVYTLVLSLAVCLNSIELSSQFECLPNGNPIPNVPRSGPSHAPSGKQHIPERSLPPAERILRERSRSPTKCYDQPIRLPSTDGKGHDLEEIEFIRLIPVSSSNRIFEFRRYTFPAKKLFRLCPSLNEFVLISNQEQIALSTSSGDVFAILESSDILGGIYGGTGRRRMKINMASGKHSQMSREEISEVPVGSRRLIKWHFRIKRVGGNPPHHTSD